MDNPTHEQINISRQLDYTITRLAWAEDHGKPSIKLYKDYLKALKRYKASGLSLLDLL
jgi:hypothetical protein